MTGLDELAAAFAAPTDAEAAELREAVAAAVANGAGFVACYLPTSRRLFTAAVVDGQMPVWCLQAVADEAEAQQAAEAHACAFVATVQRLMAVLDGVQGGLH